MRQHLVRFASKHNGCDPFAAMCDAITIRSHDLVAAVAMIARAIVTGECEMCDNSVSKQANGAESHPVTPKNEKQVAERRRRWMEDALEDDEVYEALALLHAQKNAKKDD